MRIDIKIFLVLLSAVILSFVSITCGLCAEPYEEAFKKAYPQIAHDSIRPTAIKGIYEVIKGGEIIYFLEGHDLLFVGEIIDRTGRNITEGRKADIIVSNAKDLPLDKAVRIGNGKNVIIEFTDPDCPYCRRASPFLASLKDVSRYVFFFPMPSNNDAENKIRYIFCAADKAKAYEEAMKGKLDERKYQVCKDKNVEDLLHIHKTMALRIGLTGTPMFIINGKRLVMGADTGAIDEALRE